MSFGGINGAGPQGAPIQWPPGCAGATANGATPFFSTSFESVLAAISRGEIPANLGVTASALGGQVPLLQAIAQGVPQNGTNGIGVSSGPSRYGTNSGGRLRRHDLRRHAAGRCEADVERPERDQPVQRKLSMTLYGATSPIAGGIMSPFQGTTAGVPAGSSLLSSPPVCRCWRR